MVPLVRGAEDGCGVVSVGMRVDVVVDGAGGAVVEVGGGAGVDGAGVLGLCVLVLLRA